MTRSTITLPVLAACALLSFTSLLHAQTVLIENDRFADGGGSWSLSTPAGASTSSELVAEGDSPALIVTVDTEDKKVDVRMQRVFGDINAGRTYTVKFQVKAQTAAEIVGYIYPENQTSRIVWRQPLKVGTEWTPLSYTFKGKETLSNCVLGFANLGKASNQYSFKDIELMESE